MHNGLLLLLLLRRCRDFINARQTTAKFQYIIKIYWLNVRRGVHAWLDIPRVRLIYREDLRDKNRFRRTYVARR